MVKTGCCYALHKIFPSLSPKWESFFNPKITPTQKLFWPFSFWSWNFDVQFGHLIIHIRCLKRERDCSILPDPEKSRLTSQPELESSQGSPEPDSPEIKAPIVYLKYHLIINETTLSLTELLFIEFYEMLTKFSISILKPTACDESPQKNLYRDI